MNDSTLAAPHGHIITNYNRSTILLPWMTRLDPLQLPELFLNKRTMPNPNRLHLDEDIKLNDSRFAASNILRR